MNVFSGLKKVAKTSQAYYYAKNLKDSIFNENKFVQMPEDFVNNKIIFIHIPKSAGNSVTESLFKKPSIDVMGHITAAALKGSDPKKFENYFKFTFGRHPIDRFISAFSFLKSGGIVEDDALWSKAFIKKDDGIREFVSKMRVLHFRESVMRYTHFVPQWKFVCDESGECIVDFLGKYENINSDFEIVRKRIGIGSPLKAMNVTKSKPVNSLDSDDREFILDLYKKDLAVFGY